MCTFHRPLRLELACLNHPHHRDDTLDSARTPGKCDTTPIRRPFGDLFSSPLAVSVTGEVASISLCLDLDVPPFGDEDQLIAVR